METEIKNEQTKNWYQQQLQQIKICFRLLLVVSLINITFAKCSYNKSSEMNYIAYYRVSTQQQGRSGLGLDAQRSSIISQLKGVLPLFEYTEVESGKNDNRPELEKALTACKRHNATLIVAKLDRLSRNLAFIVRLMESKVKFLCCDMPEANEFTIHIFAAIAQQERKMTSDRTKAALKAAKDRGVKLGGPNANKAWADYMRTQRKPKVYNTDLIQMIKDKRANGKSWQQIANEINTGNLRSMHDKPFSATAVWRIAKRV